MRAFAFALAGLALLSACQDSSQVGLGLIDDDAPSPNVRVLGAVTVDTLAYTLVTAGFADSSPVTQTRVLVGNVRDALYGDAQATAYLDLSGPTASLPSGFADRPVTSVRLELRRDYAYGDTTAAFPVELRQVTATWSPTGLPPDTTLATGDLLTTATISGADTLATFNLPQSWIDANAGLFTRTSFSSDFEGFELRAPTAEGDGAVFGYTVVPTGSQTRASSFVRVTTARDTVRYRISEVFSRLTQGTPGMAPAGRLLLRAGSGTGTKLTFGYGDVLRQPLAQAVFRLPLDGALAGAQGRFKRPLARVAIVGARPQVGASFPIAPLRPAAGSSDLRTTSNAGLTALVQQILLQQATFNFLEVRFADVIFGNVLTTGTVSLDVLPIVTDGAAPAAQPRLSLTVVGTTA